MAAGVVYWRYRSRLPAADWPFTVDVDRHLPELPAGPPVPERFWSAVLLEKVVLLALISVIFAQVLPDVRASNLGVADRRRGARGAQRERQRSSFGGEDGRGRAVRRSSPRCS